MIEEFKYITERPEIDYKTDGRIYCYNTHCPYDPDKHSQGFTQRFSFDVDIDIEDLMYQWTQNANIVNTLHKELDFAQYALLNMIVTQGLNDILGQAPDIDEPDDDSFARPGISNPNLDPDKPIDDDPFARPGGWNPSEGIFYDEETGNLVDSDGNVVKKANENSDHPMWRDWVKFYRILHQGIDIEDIPKVPDFGETYYEDFVNWLQAQEGNNPDAGISTPDLL